jgi:4-oxalmesaconate hydratase
MIIDCHGHYTTAPRQHEGWRNEQIEAHKGGKPPPPRPRMTDEEIRETICAATADSGRFRSPR